MIPPVGFGYRSRLLTRSGLVTRRGCASMAYKLHLNNWRLIVAGGGVHDANTFTAGLRARPPSLSSLVSSIDTGVAAASRGRLGQENRGYFRRASRSSRSSTRTGTLRPETLGLALQP